MSEQILLKIMNKLEVIGATVSSIDTRVNAVEKRLNNLDADVKELKKTSARTETELGQKVAASLDGWKQSDEKLDKIIAHLERIEDKIATHDIQISVLDRRKKRATK